MKRVAFKMTLKPGCATKYEERHKVLWPELVTLLKNSGISEYSIFLDKETHTLFAYQKIDGEKGSQDLAAEKIIQKWWKHMADIMETNDDHSPVTKPLKEVFYLK
ncbi:L-rhamnose mutarotase [Portibacter marinus]|uniref:L-rhamnose mutarotase n=1 Tax=Portibacter marinus TaxID=2898660 RepID=UPI001F2C3692|nr:L-rhamnose mutarotase [Portibacter marinus]